jgi:hypothetical protein
VCRRVEKRDPEEEEQRVRKILKIRKGLKENSNLSQSAQLLPKDKVKLIENYLIKEEVIDFLFSKIFQSKEIKHEENTFSTDNTFNPIESQTIQSMTLQTIQSQNNRDNNFLEVVLPWKKDKSIKRIKIKRKLVD